MLQKWWRELQETYYVGMNYDEGRWWFKWYCVLFHIVNGNWWLRQFCKVFGHRMECNGDIGPEHGVEQLYCTRCGWSKRIVWF